MKHLILSDYGTFVGTRSGLLVVSNKTATPPEYCFPLSRLSTLSIAKRGISISSDLIEAFSLRGIKLFFLDFRGLAHSALVASHQHAVVAVRKAQMKQCEEGNLALARKIVYGKIRNQRAVLKHLSKYHNHLILSQTSETLKEQANIASKNVNFTKLLGTEGFSARIYFQALIQSNLFPPSFKSREGRGSREIGNSMLNLGYAVLSSYVFSSIINAGLEPFLGLYHVQRPGKPALVLDLMEEYRAWVVDRAVIKLRSNVTEKKEMDSSLKKQLINEVQKTLVKKYLYRKKKVRLENIIQRQVYRLCGCFQLQQQYKPYTFKW